MFWCLHAQSVHSTRLTTGKVDVLIHFFKIPPMPSDHLLDVDKVEVPGSGRRRNKSCLRCHVLSKERSVNPNGANNRVGPSSELTAVKTLHHLE